MQSLRSAITQATRGGRWVSSRRNFSSSSVPKETNKAVDKIVRDLKESCFTFGCVIAGYLAYRAFESHLTDIELHELNEAKKLAEALRKTQN